MIHNPNNVSVGEWVSLDNNTESVKIFHITTKGMFASVGNNDEEIDTWDVMTYRLTPIKTNIMKTGIEQITAERAEQIEKHGHTIEHDINEEREGQLASAAIYMLLRYMMLDEDSKKHWPDNWGGYYRMVVDEKKGLEISRVAGALIAAEIDRVQAEK